MWDFKLGAAIGLVLRTLPFVLLRLLVYLGIALGYMLVAGVGAALGWGIGSLFGAGGQAAGAGWGGVLGVALFGGLMYWARAWLLYMVKAAHVAVLVELVNGGAIPQGRSQLEHGTNAVRQRFGTANALFAIDLLIKGVVRTLAGMARGLLRAVPGSERLGALLQAFLRVALGFVDELILARMIRTGSEEPWESARKSLVLYAQNHRPMLRNAAWLAALMYGLSILVFVVMLAPAALIAWLMPGFLSGAAVLFAALLAWSIKVGALEPLALACMMQVYFQAIEDQQPDPQWEARMAQLSTPFRNIRQRAEEALRTPERPVAAGPETQS